MSGQLVFYDYNSNMSGQITIKPSVLQILGEKLDAPVAAHDRARASLHVLDWLGTATLGQFHPAAAGFRQTADRPDHTDSAGGNASVTMLDGRRADYWCALQTNAAMGNVLEMDDLHRTSILHPGPVIVPAAIAVAEMLNASGAALLNAIVRGYEATIRIGAALGTTHYRYFHNTSTCGAFGAAAAAASLFNLDTAQTVSALANAGSRTGGLWQMRHEQCETKSLHNVMAAQSGVQAAMLAARGVRGPAHLLEGVQGLFAAMSVDADPLLVVANLDAGWRIHEVSFKPWPACRHAHPAMDAAMAVRALLTCESTASGSTASAASVASIDSIDSIESIEVSTYRSAIDFCDRPQPATELDAKFSLQHAVAVCLTKGAPAMHDFAPANLQQVQVAALRRKVKVTEDVAMTSLFPQHYSAAVTVKLADGRSISHIQHDAWGDPELPLTSTDVTHKARRLLIAANLTNTEAYISSTLALAQADSVRDWTAQWGKV